MFEQNKRHVSQRSTGSGIYELNNRGTILSLVVQYQQSNSLKILINFYKIKINYIPLNLSEV